MQQDYKRVDTTDCSPSLYRELSNGPWTVGRVPLMELQPTGTKYDADKPRTDLLDPLALEGIARVLAFGAKKYDEHNWRAGLSYSRLLGAILRHTFAILRGEDLDSESGLPHVDHLGCSVMFLSAHMKYNYLKKFDDRWKLNDNQK